MVKVVMQARTPQIAELIEACADGALPFSGPDSLCSKVAAMGYKTTSLYDMVVAVERDRLHRAASAVVTRHREEDY